MLPIETFGQELSHLLIKHKDCYIEAHLEESRSSTISYRSRMLESIGKGSSIGGNLRAYVHGGWGFVSFNNFENIEDKIHLAISEARLAGYGTGHLAEVPPVVDTVSLPLPRSPVDIPLAQKKDVLDRYNHILWQLPVLKTSVMRYSDSHKKNIFLNSEGSYIQQDRADVTLGISAVASDGNEVQQTNLSLGSPGNFSAIENLDDQIHDMGQRAAALLKAPRVTGGEYTVVLDPVLAGVFVHEAFGHLSEADFTYENNEMRQLMLLGKRFGDKHLNIVDGAAVPGLRGSYKYDDEGVAATKTYLIREGELVGRLHSRETAAIMNEAPTGNARAVNFHHAPIVRMTNTYIEPQGLRLEDMLSGIKEGVYAKGWYGGTTSMEMFTFSAEEAYMIRNGHIAELLRPVVLTGNVFNTLANIDAIGNDLEMNQGGGCGKGGQFPLPVSNGSPHIRIQKCLVGGQ